MSYYVRLMRKEDINQVSAIDREAFSSIWVPVNYQRELQNKLAHYIVACDEEKEEEAMRLQALLDENSNGFVSRVRRLFGRYHSSNNVLSSPSRDYVVGFAGFWVMADEAHITSIAVRDIKRRQGIGELLLISTIELAAELNANNVTLEVRVSNDAAHKLYYKCGFEKTGLRRGYYTDNREDALLMSTEDITTASFEAHLQQLKQAHSKRWGVTLHRVTH